MKPLEIRKHKAALHRIAASLREFGYQDVTAEMVAEIHTAYVKGEKHPHGVVGMIVYGKMEEAGIPKGGALE